MSVKAMGWAKEQTTGASSSKLVLIVLSDYYDDERGIAWPSIPRLARECEMSERTVYRHLNDLETAGFLVRHRRQNEDGSATSNAYSLRFDRGDDRMSPPDTDVTPPLTPTSGTPLTPTSPKQLEGTPVEQTVPSGTDVKVPFTSLWKVWLEVLGLRGENWKLTTERRRKIRLLWEEQLSKAKRPEEAFRWVAMAVKGDSWRRERETRLSMPEVVFRNEERREAWYLKAVELATERKEVTKELRAEIARLEKPVQCDDGHGPRYAEGLCRQCWNQKSSREEVLAKKRDQLRRAS